MQFEARNAPWIFQHGKDVILSHFRWQSASVFSDGFEVFTCEQNKSSYKFMLFSWAKEGEVSLNLKNCKFFGLKPTSFEARCVQIGWRSHDVRQTQPKRFRHWRSGPPLKCVFIVNSFYNRFVLRSTGTMFPSSQWFMEGEPSTFEIKTENEMNDWLPCERNLCLHRS